MKEPETEKLTVSATTLDQLGRKVDDATERRVVHKVEQHTAVAPDGTVEYQADIVRSKKQQLNEG